MWNKWVEKCNKPGRKNWLESYIKKMFGIVVWKIVWKVVSKVVWKSLVAKLYGEKYTVYCVQYTVYSVKCTVYSVQCTVCDPQFVEGASVFLSLGSVTICQAPALPHPSRRLKWAVVGDLKMEWNFVVRDAKMEWNLVVGDPKMVWNLVVGDPKMEWNFNLEKIYNAFLRFF